MSSYLTSVLIFTGINLIAVLGMFLLMGLTGLLSFGQVGFMAIELMPPPWAIRNLACPLVSVC